MAAHGNKLSQKQRKMIALAARDSGSVGSSTEPPVVIPTPPPKVAKLGSAWYVRTTIASCALQALQGSSLGSSFLPESGLGSVH